MYLKEQLLPVDIHFKVTPILTVGKENASYAVFKILINSAQDSFKGVTNFIEVPALDLLSNTVYNELMRKEDWGCSFSEATGFYFIYDCEESDIQDIVSSEYEAGNLRGVFRGLADPQNVLYIAVVAPRTITIPFPVAETASKLYDCLQIVRKKMVEHYLYSNQAL